MAFSVVKETWKLQDDQIFDDVMVQRRSLVNDNPDHSIATKVAVYIAGCTYINEVAEGLDLVRDDRVVR